MIETRKYCVYNQTRESFLSLGVVIADSAARQLKALLENLSVKSDAGLWLTPFRGIPATKGLTPVDVIYLDDEYRVIQAIESFPNHAGEPPREQPASALILAGYTIFSSQTQPGDLLLICAPEEMEDRLGSSGSGRRSSPQFDRSDQTRSGGLAVAEPPAEVNRAVELLGAHQRLLEKDSAETDGNNNVSWFIR